MKFKVAFYPAGLPYTIDLWVIAPTRRAAERFVKRESPGCEIVSLEPASDRNAVYAVSDEHGGRQ